MRVHRRTLLSVLGSVSLCGIAGCGDKTDSGSEQSEGGSNATVHPLRDETVVPTAQSSKFAPETGASGDEFGAAVGLSGNGRIAVVGASGDQERSDDDPGAAYVFRLAEREWTQRAVLSPADWSVVESFGSEVAVSSDGTTVLANAELARSSGQSNQMAVYIFERSGTGWTQQTRITGDDDDKFQAFGDSLDISATGRTALLGAFADSKANGQVGGAAYVFRRRGGRWRRQAKLAADDGDAFDSFGFSVALSADGDRALIGARRDEDPNAVDAGAAYVVERTTGEWRRQFKIAPSNGTVRDFFGYAVGLSGDGTTAVMSAPRDGQRNGPDSGSVYVYDRHPLGWQFHSQLTAPDGASGDLFGATVDIATNGQVLLVGSFADDRSEQAGEFAGSAYIFSRSGSVWEYQAKLTATDGNQFDSFGYAVALAAGGTRACIGARGEENPNGDRAGAAYVFE